jgi:hypothetical protein
VLIWNSTRPGLLLLLLLLLLVQRRLEIIGSFFCSFNDALLSH